MMALCSAGAQELNESPYEKGDVVYIDSVRYMVTYVSASRCYLREYTPVDTLNYDNTKIIKYNSSWDVMRSRGLFKFNSNDKAGGSMSVCIGYEGNVGVGLSMDIWSLYLKFAFSSHKVASDVSRGIYEPGNYNDGKFHMFNIGCRVPISKGFNIISVVGMYNYEKGITHVYRYNWGWCRGDYRSVSNHSYFNYGAVVEGYWEFGRMRLSASVEVTNHCTSIGFGMAF